MDAIYCGYLNELFIRNIVFVPTDLIDGFKDYAASIGQYVEGGAMSFDRLGTVLGQYFFC